MNAPKSRDTGQTRKGEREVHAPFIATARSCHVLALSNYRHLMSDGPAARYIAAKSRVRQTGLEW